MGSAKDIEAQAARWLVRLDADPTPEHRAELEAWCTRHPRHHAAFLRLAAAWKRADALRNVRMPDMPVNADLLAPPRQPAHETRYASKVGLAQPTPAADLHRRHRRFESDSPDESHEAREQRSRLWLMAVRLWRALGPH